MRTIFTVSGDAKTIKGEEFGYLTAVCYGIPGKFENVVTCPFATSCLDLCLRDSGHLVFQKNKDVAAEKMHLLLHDIAQFKAMAYDEIADLAHAAKRKGLKPAVRFDGTTDYIGRRMLDVMAKFPDVQFYDYTKYPPQSWPKAPNYHLTFSLSEKNTHHALKAIDLGYNVAVPFHHVKPTTYWGRPVIDGDLSDLRFLDNLAYPSFDGKGSIVALSAKGVARKAPYGPNMFIK